MKRSEFLRLVAAGTAGIFLRPWNLAGQPVKAGTFGKNFVWGVATSAFQSEGAWNADGKGPSIWDTFSHTKGKIKDESNADTACDFYHRYPGDLELLKGLHFGAFRFSISWPRILPDGTGKLNPKGIDFYNRVIDTCLEQQIEPWATLYHWDLPQALEDRGGWVNRDVVSWFSEYTARCAEHFGDRVKHWMVLNEPAAFTTFGYLTGLHAPGHRGLNKFLAAVHHATLCQAAGGRVLRGILPQAHIGTTFSCSYIDPKKAKPRFYRAAKRLDVVMNRLFIEPALGMGYPSDDLPFLKKIDQFMLPGDQDQMKFDFDFIGLQNYFRVIGKPGLTPFIWAQRVKPGKYAGELTEMGWEVYPEGIYKIIKQFARYPVKEIVISENGAAFQDTLQNNRVHDKERVAFFQEYLQQVLKAKNDGVNITGYFVWSFTDNFEWAEGYRPRFGIVYNDFVSQQRTIKDSGLWFRWLLQ